MCRNCTHHDLVAHHECREPLSEWVREKDRTNVCEYFVLADRSGVNRVDVDGERGVARERLAAVFKK